MLAGGLFFQKWVFLFLEHHVLFLVTKFLFLELLPTGPVSRFLGVRDHLLQRLMHS